MLKFFRVSGDATKLESPNPTLEQTWIYLFIKSGRWSFSMLPLMNRMWVSISWGKIKTKKLFPSRLIHFLRPKICGFFEKFAVNSFTFTTPWITNFEFPTRQKRCRYICNCTRFTSKRSRRRNGTRFTSKRSRRRNSARFTSKRSRRRNGARFTSKRSRRRKSTRLVS